MMTLDLQGANALIAKMRRLTTGELAGATARGVAETTVEAHGMVVEAVSRAGSGRVYTRRGVSHRASAPGEPPAVDTGSYRASIHFDLPAGVGPVPEGRVLTNDRRGPWLEYGTRTMAPRPHFGPVSERLRADGTLPRNVARHVDAALRGGEASGGT